MKLILQEKNQYVLKFERGEEVVEALKQFCKKENISSAFFQGLGACSYLKLASYNLSEKNYEEREFNQNLEIANLVGNISTADGELVIHMHGTFSDHELRALAGHVLAVIISATCELMLTKFSKPMTRKLDPEIGLKFLR